MKEKSLTPLALRMDERRAAAPSLSTASTSAAAAEEEELLGMWESSNADMRCKILVWILSSSPAAIVATWNLERQTESPLAFGRQ